MNPIEQKDLEAFYDFLVDKDYIDCDVVTFEYFCDNSQEFVNRYFSSYEDWCEEVSEEE
jgi:hypothetical protein